MKTTPKLGIHVARLIVRGDVHQARNLASDRTSWSIPEARAIAGACRLARSRGWPVDFNSFFGASK